MIRIQPLDPETVRRIAAGEVIERPTSVVKELLDNALDAGSTRIDIDLRNGGRQVIQVTDNGCGMSAPEAPLALQRFTTSKLRHIDDLQTLTTLGFRGEALPSMAAVATVEITSRPAGSQEGVWVQSRDGAEPQGHPIGCPLGTRVRVLQLFAHVPVRLQALKSVAREVQQIHDLVAHYALAHPQVTFHLQHDGRRLLFAAASGDLRQRLAAVWSFDLAAQMLPVQWQNLDVSIHGAISPPDLNRSTRQRQYLWVNGRPLHSGLVSTALVQGYGGRLPPGRHPLVALGLTLSPTLLDVNIHPRKSEIKFLHERAIFAAVREAVERTIQGLEMPSQSWEDTPQLTTWDTIPVAPDTVHDSEAQYQAPRPVPTTLQPLGQLGNTFILASGAAGLVLLDQHAAHESLLYDRLIAASEAPQELQEALVLHLTASQQRWCLAAQPAWEALHFHLDSFGKDAYIVRAMPLPLSGLLQAGNMLEAITEAMQRSRSLASPESQRDHLAAALACRTAVRAGDRLSQEHMTALVTAAAQQRLPYTCPHGRPTYVTLSLAELERRFLRL